VRILPKLGWASSCAGLLALVLLTAPLRVEANPPRLAFPPEFSVPAGMEARVQFWVDVFGRYSARDAIVHDRNHPHRILANFSMRRGNQRERREIQARYANLLREIQQAQSPLERRAILNQFDGPVDGRWLQIPPEDVRVFQGQSETFAKSLKRSRYYSRTVRRELAQAGLPPLLIYLPHIESSYDPAARSNAGALGLWQLMPNTARQYIRVGGRSDERRDPKRSTYAAAQFLHATHRSLRSWPLALTAYNHGPTAVSRAINRHRTTDLGELIYRNENRRFGFAGANFYAKFLAAAHLGENTLYYFPNIDMEEIVTHTVRRGDTLWAIARRYGISLRALKRSNAHELSRSKYLKPGLRLLVEG
jgi:membrane-bound lytic murein transglycosylase D